MGSCLHVERAAIVTVTDSKQSITKSNAVWVQTAMLLARAFGLV